MKRESEKKYRQVQKHHRAASHQTVIEPVPDCTSCLLYLLVCVVAAPDVAVSIPVSISLFPLDSIAVCGCVFCCCVHRCVCRLSQHCHHHHHHSRICWGCTSSAASQPVCCCYSLNVSSIVVAPESPPDPARLLILQGGCYQAPHPHCLTSPRYPKATPSHHQKYCRFCSPTTFDLRIRTIVYIR